MNSVTEALIVEFGQRQARNPSYSFRAFARDLAINPGSLKKILAGERTFPKRRLGSLVKTLKLSPVQKSKLLGEPIPDDRLTIDQRHYHILAEWEHFAVLSLLETPRSRATTAFVAERLGITAERAYLVLNRLKEAGLIAPQGKLSQLGVKTSEDVSSAALKEAHHQELALAGKKLEAIAPVFRDFSSTTLAFDLSKMKEAKALIRDFRRRMAELVESGSGTEVYQLCVQIYPLTVLRKKS